MNSDIELWALRPEILDTIGDPSYPNTPHRAQSRAEQTRAVRRDPLRVGSVAVVPIRGIITHRTSAAGETSMASLRARLRWALADSAVRAILLHVDSPGGTVDGLHELAGEIRKTRRRKRIAASIDTLAASGAYWLASQADEIALTPSGEVGSIGVYAIHRDHSHRLEQAGIKTTLIKAGKHKVEGNPFEPLTTDARAALQARVNEVYRLFVTDVAAGRGVSVGEVRRGYGQGRLIGARAALLTGMVDRIATFERQLTLMR